MAGVFWTKRNCQKHGHDYMVAPKMNMHTSAGGCPIASNEICRHTPDARRAVCHFIMQLKDDFYRKTGDCQDDSTTCSDTQSGCNVMFPACSSSNPVSVLLSRDVACDVWKNIRLSGQCYVMVLCHHSSYYTTRVGKTMYMKICFKNPRLCMVSKANAASIEELHKRVFVDKTLFEFTDRLDVRSLHLTLGQTESPHFVQKFMLAFLYGPVDRLVIEAYRQFLKEYMPLNRHVVRARPRMIPLQSALTNVSNATDLAGATVASDKTNTCKMRKYSHVLDISMYSDEEIQALILGEI